MLTEERILELIATGEGSIVEFKESVPSKVRELSEEVCAFANATGGYIFIGITNDGQFVKNFTINNSKRSAIQNSLDEIVPEVDCNFYPMTVLNHEIWVLEVAEGTNKPYFTSGSVYVRRGANSQKLRKPADVRQFFENAGSLHYDEAICKWFGIHDVSDVEVNILKNVRVFRLKYLLRIFSLILDCFRTKGKYVMLFQCFFILSGAKGCNMLW